MQVNIKHLIDEVPWYQTVREVRWLPGVAWPFCQSTQAILRGLADTASARQH
jgi:hypothetical protein